MRAIGQLFFNSINTTLSGDFAYVSGDQDIDSGAGPDPLEVLAWGAEVEHDLGVVIGDAAAALFIAYQGLQVSERSTGGGIERLTDHAVLGGIRFRLDPMTPAQRARNTAPRLPNVGLWLGATPAVD